MGLPVRTVAALAVPTIAALLGLIFFWSRKKPDREKENLVKVSKSSPNTSEHIKSSHNANITSEVNEAPIKEKPVIEDVISSQNTFLSMSSPNEQSKTVTREDISSNPQSVDSEVVPEPTSWYDDSELSSHMVESLPHVEVIEDTSVVLAKPVEDCIKPVEDKVVAGVDTNLVTESKPTKDYPGKDRPTVMPVIVLEDKTCEEDKPVVVPVAESKKDDNMPIFEDIVKPVVDEPVVESKKDENMPIFEDIIKPVVEEPVAECKTDESMPIFEDIVKPVVEEPVAESKPVDIVDGNHESHVTSEDKPVEDTNNENIIIEPVSEEKLSSQNSNNVSSEPTEVLDTECKCDNSDPSSDSNKQQAQRPDNIAIATGPLLPDTISSPNNDHHINSSDSVSDASEASNDSGKGASVSEQHPPTSQEFQLYQFTFPSELCALLVGRKGRTVNHIRQESGANITLLRNPFTKSTQICSIEGSESEVQVALEMIKKRFPSSRYPNIDFTQLNQPQDQSPVLSPDIMQLPLPEGVLCETIVSSIVNAGLVFLQQPTHPSFPSLERLTQCMYACYTQELSIPELPRPIESGVICAAQVLDGWYRAQVISHDEVTDECQLRYIDFGGYSVMPAATLKQIRSDFMTLPFQASECYMANIAPLEGEENFSLEASAVLEDLTRGQVLECQILGHDIDSGIPYIELYSIQGAKAVLLNREMVEAGVCRWVEMTS